MTMDESERHFVEQCAGDRLALIAASFDRLTGESLVPDGADLWTLPLPVLAHDTQASPRFIYANRAALSQFRMGARDMIGMESRRSAEPDLRAARQAMFDRLESANVVTGYEGIRIAADGSRFRMVDAVIWNLVDEAGQRHGQAALLRRCVPLAS